MATLTEMQLIPLAEESVKVQCQCPDCYYKFIHIGDGAPICPKCGHIELGWGNLAFLKQYAVYKEFKVGPYHFKVIEQTGILFDWKIQVTAKGFKRTIEFNGERDCVFRRTLTLLEDIIFIEKKFSVSDLKRAFKRNGLPVECPLVINPERKIEEVLNRYMHTTQEYSIIESFYQHHEKQIAQNGGVAYRKNLFKLFKARVTDNSPSDILLDTDGLINPSIKTVSYFRETDAEQIENIISQLPYQWRDDLHKEVKRGYVGDWTPGMDKIPMSQMLVSQGRFLKSMPTVRDVSTLFSELDWHYFVDSLTSFKTQLPQELVQIRKAYLPRGIIPRFNPNGIISTTPGIGKTLYHSRCGKVLGKLSSKNSPMPYKSGKEIVHSFLKGLDIPVAFDLIESQLAYDLFGYLYNVSEDGYDTIGSGGQDIRLECSAPFVFLSNVQYKADFGYVNVSITDLMSHIATNQPALGRRIGLIYHNDNLEPLTQDNLNDAEKQEWGRRFLFYRSLEQQLLPKIHRIYEETSDWLLQRINRYSEDIEEIVANLEDRNLKEFYVNHGKAAQHRVRGWAFNAVVPYHFPEIFNNTLNLRDVLTEAEEVLQECVIINKQSIARQINTWNTQKIHLSGQVLNVLPEYLKTLVAIVQIYKEQNPLKVPEILLEHLYNIQESKTSGHIGIQGLGDLRLHLPQVIQSLKRTKGIEKRYNEYLSYFGFNIIKTANNQIKVRFLQ